MEIKLYNQSAEEMGNVELPDNVFNIEINNDLLHQALLAHLGNSRKITAHTKGRGEVRGGGKKPWRQKGTGRARHGSSRSPIWKGGGVTHGPLKVENYSKKINKNAKRKALFMALSSKTKDNQILVLDRLNLAEAKTKNMAGILDKLSLKLEGYRKTKNKRDSILLVAPKPDTSVLRTVRNIPYIALIKADSLNVKDILEKKYLLLLKDSISMIESTYKI